MGVDFLESFQVTEVTTISQMMWAAMSSNSFVIAKFATAKLKMKTLPAGFSVALCSTAIQFSIDIVIEVFSSFELLILSLTLLMFWTNRSQRLLRFRQVSVLQFKALFQCNGKFWSLSKRLLGLHQHSNEEPNVWRSIIVQLV